MLSPEKYHVSLLCLLFLRWHIGTPASSQDMFYAQCYTDTRRKGTVSQDCDDKNKVRPETLGTMPPLRMKHCFLPHMKMRSTKMPSVFHIYWLATPSSYEFGQTWNAPRASEGAGIKLCCWLAAYVICGENDGRREGGWLPDNSPA